MDRNHVDCGVSSANGRRHFWYIGDWPIISRYLLRVV